MYNLNRIICKYNTNPITGEPMAIHVIRRHTVSLNCNHIILDYIPDEKMGIRILDPLNIYQVHNSDEIVEGTFFVDYNNGKLYFDKSMMGKEVLVDYYDIGLEMVGVDRIYTAIDSKGNVIETLGDIIRDSRTVIDTLLTMNDVIIVVEELKESIKIGNDVYERLGSLIDEASQFISELTQKIKELKNAISDAETEKQEVETVIENAKDKKNELITVTSSADTKKEELKNAISNANTKKGELESTTNSANIKKTELQGVIDDSVVKKNELQSTINDSVIKKNELQDVINSGDYIAILNRLTELEKKGIKTLWTGIANELGNTITLSDSMQNFDKFVVYANMFGYRECLCNLNTKEDIIISSTNLENNMESSVIQVFEIILEKVTDTELKIKFIKRVNNGGQINNTSMSITKIEGIKF